MNLIEWGHGRWVHDRRCRVIAGHLASWLPHRARVADVGSGDGRLGARLMQLRPDVEVTGFDVLERPRTAIPTRLFDGQALPAEDRAFDAALLVDVLHHTDDPGVLLAEAARVSSGRVLIKDHLRHGWGAQATLAWMDHVGNERHGVRLPHHYLTRGEWDALFQRTGLQVSQWTGHLGLYPFPASLLFERRLHFAARLSFRG